MGKRILYIFIGISCVTGSLLLFFSRNSKSLPIYCAFCDNDILNRQKFYEDDLVFALYTHKPILPGHCLIIPKRQVERFEELTDQELTQMGRVIKKVNQAAQQLFKTSSYLLLQKNGPEAGQSIPHVHFHYIPKKEGDRSSIKFLFKMYMANFFKPISADEMQCVVKEMRKAMEEGETQEKKTSISNDPIPNSLQRSKF
jgi:histidine triad (HIT) family protein